MNFFNQIARKKLKETADWEFCIVKALDSGDILVKGCIPRLLKSGKRKGEKKWDSPLKTCVVTKAESQDAENNFEVTTGSCHKCGGEKQVFYSWDINTGSKYKECPRCKGTGQAPTP